MNSKSGLKEQHLSIATGEVRNAIISHFEPIWRTVGLVKETEVIVDVQFNVEGLSNMTVVPITVKIQREKEVYLEEYNGG